MDEKMSNDLRVDLKGGKAFDFLGLVIETNPFRRLRVKPNPEGLFCVVSPDKVVAVIERDLAIGANLP
jgi:hypothetical protein